MIIVLQNGLMKSEPMSHSYSGICEYRALNTSGWRLYALAFSVIFRAFLSQVNSCSAWRMMSLV